MREERRKTCGTDFVFHARTVMVAGGSIYVGAVCMYDGRGVTINEIGVLVKDDERSALFGIFKECDCGILGYSSFSIFCSYIGDYHFL